MNQNGVRAGALLLARIFENKHTRPVKRSLVRKMAAGRGSRAVLNKYYDLVNDHSKAHFYARYSKIFREQGIQLIDGAWKVKFAKRTIQLPLRSAWSWLDWDQAMSFIGHEIEIKQTYFNLINSNLRPKYFLDIGANYGIHSIFFLAAGIPVSAFEPNPDCFPYFRTVCEMNGLSGNWEEVAIGNRSGQIELVYPERETWLGSTSPEVISNFRSSMAPVSRKVRVGTLDEYLQRVPHERVLIKIDVEGAEIEVLQGASKLLNYCRPTIIFESNDPQKRWDLFQKFEQINYSVHALPWRPSPDSRCLNLCEFESSTSTNFIAIERVI
jgi:FkbM family methyltransferase